MVAPLLLVGAGLLGGVGLGLGAGGSDGGIKLASPDSLEIGTKKTSYQLTDQTQNTITNTFAPTINRQFDVQYNIASGYQSSISTKKESSVSQEPSINPLVTPILSATPITQQGGSSSFGGSSSGGGTSQIMSIALIGGLGYVAYTFLVKKEKKKK